MSDDTTTGLPRPFLSVASSPMNADISPGGRPPSAAAPTIELLRAICDDQVACCLPSLIGLIESEE